MSIWLGKLNESENLEKYENKDDISNEDSIYLYSDDYESGIFKLLKKYNKEYGFIEEDMNFYTKNIDIPYTLLYKTKSGNILVELSEKEENFILNPIKLSQFQLEIETFISDDINYNSPHKNLLLKGVPGTGKSHTLENIIENDLNLKDNPKNICHINIHSASSNADLMQGIGINSNNGQIEYKEKQGLIYNHIKKALFTPNQPFVLILEEIQENSLNELIGDLIYLIEEKKRVTVDANKFEDGKEYDYQEFIEKVLEDEKNNHSIEIPFLVDTSTDYRKMVLPSNLYVFCTSNYRDDKKVIEDNLLRRFDVVEIYPQYQDKLGKDVFKSKEVSDFLSNLNRLIEEKFEVETHPDRYLVGHANWLSIGDEENEDNKRLFYTALLKVLVEFKEIREVDFNTYVEPILEELFKDEESLYPTVKKYLDECKFEYKSYKEMVEKLQKEIYSFLK